MKYITFENVAIIGTGYVGTSIGLAVKKLGISNNITGFDMKQENLERANKLGAIDYFETSLNAVCRNKNLIILATPIQKILDFIPQVAEFSDANCTVMDIGSTKSDIVMAARRSFPANKFFIGTHPKVNPQSSQNDQPDPAIFRGHCCYITVGTKSSHKAASDVVLFWKSLGMTPIIMRPERHDYLECITNHLPHLAAVALARTADAYLLEDLNFLNRILGDNFRNGTKSVNTTPDNWMGIFKSNQVNLIKVLADLKLEIEDMMQDIQTGNLDSLRKRLNDARVFRSEISDEQNLNMPSDKFIDKEM